MNKQAVWSIARKDMRGITSNIQIWLPMLILPLILGVILPGVLVTAAGRADLAAAKESRYIIEMIDNLPPGDLKNLLAGLPSLNHKLVYVLINYMFAPLFLLIPVMASSVIGANSFVGEKERKTLESLLFAPIDLQSLFLGKVLSAFIPAMAVSWCTFILYGVTVNSIAYPMFRSLIFPNWNWLALLVWVIPVLSISIILINVLISAKVKGYQEAYQLGGLVILPVLGLVAGQMTGLLFLNSATLLIIGAAIFAVNLWLFRRVARWNSRNKLFESQV